MTPERMMVKLAKWAGWQEHDWAPVPVVEGWATWKSPDGKWFVDPPNYPNDLNAVRELEMKLRKAPNTFQPGGIGDYMRTLLDVLGFVPVDLECDDSVCALMLALAPQRCEALCRTLGLWED